MDISMKMKEAIKWVLTFAVLSILLLIVGQLVLAFFTINDGSSCSGICDFYSWMGYLKTVFFQCLCLLVVTLLTIKWIYKKQYYLIFPITQFLFLNAVFFLNIELIEGKIKLWITTYSFAYYCFLHGGNIIVDFLYCKIPFHGIFDGGFFIPNSTIYAYILFVVTPLINFIVLTRTCGFIVRKKLSKKE